MLDGFGTWLSVRIRNSVNVLDWVLGDVKKCCVELISLGEIQGHVLVKICAYYLHKLGSCLLIDIIYDAFKLPNQILSTCFGM